MKEEKVIDLVKLDLCEYQAIKSLVQPFSLLREENDPVIEVSPYEALVIQDASKIGALESLPNPGPQQEILNGVQIPKNLKADRVLTDPGEEVNVQGMDSWSVFTDRLRYTAPAAPAPGHDIQGQGCLDFSAGRVNRLDQARDVGMAPLDFKSLQASEYMDRYNDITIELNVNIDYDDAVDVTTTYLGREAVNITDIFQPEQDFPIYSNCHARGQFAGGGMIDILLDTGASKSYMSKGFYMRHPHLHRYPKFNSTIKNLQVGNGELVAALFVIPFVFKIREHLFEIYTLASEIQQSMDLIIGVKNMFELEGEVSCRTSQFKFLNRSLPLFPLSTHRIKVGAKAYVKAKVPFIEKLSGHAIAKLLYKGSLGTMRIRLVDNITVMQIINNTPTTMYFSPEQSIGIVDIRSLGYYNIKPEVLHFNLTGFHGLSSRWDMDPHFEECFAKFSTQNVHYKKKGTKERGPDPYPWLDKDDPRRHMTDEEILYKYIDLSNHTSLKVKKRKSWISLLATRRLSVLGMR